jgi:hypothetical protein
MKYRAALPATVLALFVLAPVGFSQTAPETGGAQTAPETSGALAPTRNPQHPTSGESLAAQAQDLTKKIQEAKAQGRDTSAALSEQSQGEQAMQKGDSQEALRHFEAGEHDLGTAGSSQPPAGP